MPPTSLPGVTARCSRTQRVLEAAASVFLKHGFSAASTDMIQQAAGVSKATVYACFQSKEALFEAVIEHECTRFADAVRAVHLEQPDFASRLRALGQAYLGLLLSERGLALYRVVVAEGPRFPKVARTFYLSGPAVVYKMMSEHLNKAVEDGQADVHAMGVEGAARQFLSLLRGDAQMECLTHPEARPSEAQRDAWVEAAVTTFLRAFSV